MKTIDSLKNIAKKAVKYTLEGCPYFAICQNNVEKDDDGEEEHVGCKYWVYRIFFRLPIFWRCELYKKYQLEESKTI